MSMLHIVNKAHTQTSALASCLRLAQDGHALLLAEDAVLSATRAAATASGIAAAAARLEIYALAGDLAARGVAAQLAQGVTAVDYSGFVDLVAEHANNQSWI
jgi:tRNA 2-thiouridine synthesizing protein B